MDKQLSFKHVINHFKGGGAKLFYMEQYVIKEDNVDLKNY